MTKSFMLGLIAAGLLGTAQAAPTTSTVTPEAVALQKKDATKEKKKKTKAPKKEAKKEEVTIWILDASGKG